MNFIYSYQLRLQDGAPIRGWGTHVVSCSSTINRATFVRYVSIREW